ncbi:MAG TPA: hypothetical protein VHA56_11615 [Mucilaginibacter sp.]|nr:hypothetical protein [Mucilaginibacter sp.]
MTFKVVPFKAKISRGDTSATVAAQMQAIIDSHSDQGWNYMRMDSVETFVAPTKGCFGFGSIPGTTTAYNVLVFSRP